MAGKVLLSGATGFIAGHTIEQLLAAGYEVTGTVRNPGDKAKVAHLAAMQGAERLHLVAADLTDPDPFTAHADVDAILHMASPYIITVKDAQRDLVIPAVEGTLSMLRAAKANPRVRRVVLTSSLAAMTDAPDGRVLSEADWNTKSTLKRNPYYYSKTLAERAAWDFMAREKPKFDLVAINPFLVIGPSLSGGLNPSTQIIADVVNGKYPAVMDLTWGFADVRDVAAAHIAALKKPAAAGRYLCASGTMHAREVMAEIRALGYGAKLPRLDLSGPFGIRLSKLISYTQPAGVGSYLRSHLGGVMRLDNSKSVRDLGITYRSQKDSLRDTLADLERSRHIPARA